MDSDGSEPGGATKLKREEPEDLGIGAEDKKLVPIVDFAKETGEWWSIPQEVTASLYDKYVNGQDAVYTWD